MRQPGEPRGQVIGLLLREFPRVVGDGMRTVAELMAAHPRARRLGRDGASEPCCDLAAVPRGGEVVRLATVASTRVDGLYRDGTGLVTPELTAVMDMISQDMKDFHVGRFDVKYSHLDALRAGNVFRIIEVNGAGSEAVHAWDPDLSLRQAYGIVFDKRRRLFAIGDAMRRLGQAPVGWSVLLHHHFKQQALIARYPPIKLTPVWCDRPSRGSRLSSGSLHLNPKGSNMNKYSLTPAILTLSATTAMAQDIMMKDGKMMTMKDGQSMAMEKDMTMSNGNKIMMDGTVMMKDGKKMEMKDGMMMDDDGLMMDHNGMMMK